jgi:hypothetical protein
MEAIEWRPSCEGTTQWRSREMHRCTDAIELQVAMMHTANFCISAHLFCTFGLSLDPEHKSMG